MSREASELARARRDAVQAAYSRVAVRPAEPQPFPVGRALAEGVGYTAEALAGVPEAAVEAFAGVAAVSVFADLAPGARVLDLGCGAGLDSLVAARRVGPGGRVVGVDFSATMLERARRAADTAGLAPSFVRASAERLPCRDAAFDHALVNGIFNLNPARGEIFWELARCVRPGGTLYAAELVLRAPLPAEARSATANWLA